MVKAIQFHKAGGPSVIKWEEVKLGKPRKGQALVRHTAIGLNYIDTYQRSGMYPMPLPSGLGMEAAGVVEAVGAGVKHVKAGDRVAYGSGAPGAYSEARVMDAATLVKIPRGIPDEAAYTAAYAKRTGRDALPDWEFYMAYNLFRMAAILQGIMGRVRDGTAANPEAARMGALVRPLADLAWAQAEKIGD